MYKEFALYKTNRDMLDKRYNLKTEEQRVREIEFAHKIKESQQKLEIEMKKAKDAEVQEIKEVAMVRHKDTIDKLKMELEETIREFDNKGEENELISAIIKELEIFKFTDLFFCSEQAYNWYNECEDIDI